MRTKIFLYTVLFFFILSCNEDKILQEKPLDFYSIENAYVTANDFQSAINRLYSQIRDDFSTNFEGKGKEIYFFGTDLCVNAITPDWPLNTYSAIVPTDGFAVATTWKRMYKLISDANVIVGRIDVATIENADKNKLKAEAMFFRAFGYRCLANLYGGVPLVLKEVTSPARDYVRATRDQVYQQCATDLEFAAANLNDITAAKDGQINKAAANHLLSEIYISLKQWDKAIAAASATINNPALGLMTSRFGSKKNEPGDVISDLFRNNNFNRSSGNTEGLWVIQLDYKSQGSPNYGWAGDLLQGFINCFYTNIILDDGVNAFPSPNQQFGGWGIGWLKTTQQAHYGVWKSDFTNDLRNSQYNIIRDIKVLNPKSKYYGQYIVANKLVQPYDTTRNWYPIYTKGSRWNDFPAEVIANATTGEVNYDVSINKDTYMFRMAETYLLRAEAYLGKGDKQSAANDINLVRVRAQAKPVAAVNVDIDFILDERLRELPYEELRIFTLTRLGKLVDRVKKYNYYAKSSIKDYQNLYPIPYSEIERNTLSKLEQNPGY